MEFDTMGSCNTVITWYGKTQLGGDLYLDPDTVYTATVEGIADKSGNLSDPHTWSFRTEEDGFGGGGLMGMGMEMDGGMLLGGGSGPIADGVQQQTSYYYLGGQRVAMRVDAGGESTVYYLHGDHLGSTSLVVDDTGAEVARQLYYPYGEVRHGAGSLPTDFGYTGQRDVPSTGLMYYRARFYHPALGRFVSADTIVPEPGNPQDFNRYAYVSNNPLKFVDPTGHDPIPPTPTVEPSEDDPVPPTELSLSYAQKVFGAMASHEGIAFRWVERGCAERAHIMVGEMQDMGVEPAGKAWAFSLSYLSGIIDGVPSGPSLRVQTQYAQDGSGVVEWDYHVAPVILVDQGDGTVQQMVIDPSLFDGPVLLDEWLDAQQPVQDYTVTDLGEGPLGVGTGYFPLEDPVEDLDVHAWREMKVNLLRAIDAFGPIETIGGPRDKEIVK
jgi:RHS repeat-associated protein